MVNGFFITGSDTDVGKTWIACQLINQLNTLHHSIKVRKPIESGCEVSANGQLFPGDGFALFQANAKKESLDIITPYRFRAALAPDRAARLENKAVSLKQLIQAVNHRLIADDTLLVEGAGGFYSPLCDDGLNSDLAKSLGLDIIIVIDDRLGAINQALLTIKAVESEGLKIHAIILNQVNESPAEINGKMNNLADLLPRTRYPVFHCLYQSRLNKQIFQ